jgi:hypothetical protein
LARKPSQRQLRNPSRNSSASRRPCCRSSCRSVTFAKKRYKLPSGSTLQPLDQWGNPLPKQPSGSYEVALPIQGGGTAWGDNRVTRAKMTVADANDFTWMVMTEDMDWMARHVLAAIFTNITWTYTDDNDEIGDLTIQPLANNDSVVYTRKGGQSSTDNHFLAQANAISDTDNPFPTIKNELMEHPSNSGDVVSYVPTNEVDDIKSADQLHPGRGCRRSARYRLGYSVADHRSGCWR